MKAHFDQSLFFCIRSISLPLCSRIVQRIFNLWDSTKISLSILLFCVKCDANQKSCKCRRIRGFLLRRESFQFFEKPLSELLTQRFFEDKRRYLPGLSREKRWNWKLESGFHLDCIWPFPLRFSFWAATHEKSEKFVFTASLAKQFCFGNLPKFYGTQPLG